MNVLLLIAALVLPSMTPQFGPVPVGSVSGQLSSKNGQSVSGIRISAMAVPEPGVPVASASTLLSFVMTDSAGRYRLENVPVGRYYIVAGLVDQPTYYPGVSSQTGATVVTVTAGSSLANIDFGLVVPVGLSVRGKVIRPSNAPINGIQRVSIFGGVAGTLSSTIAADGSFEIANVRPGQYSLSVNSGTLSLAQPIPFSVTDKDVTGLEAVMVQTVAVNGNVMVEGDGLRPRIQLTLSSYKGGINSPFMSVLQDGSIRGTVPEGEYRLSWSNLPAGYFVKSVTMGSVDLLASPLKVQADTPVQSINILLGVASPPPWTRLRGRVVGLNPTLTGTPIHLNLTGTSLLETLDTIVAPDGSFEFSRVLAGNYAARFPALPVAAVNLFVPGGGITSVDIPVPPLKQFSGRVVIEGLSQIVPRLVFTWTEPAGAGSAGINTNQPTNSSPVNARPDGTFSVILPEGERKVILNAFGYSVQSLTYGSIDLLKQPLKASAANSDEIRVTLAPSANPAVNGLGAATGIGPAPGFVVGGVAGGVPGGVPGGVVPFIIAPGLPSSTVLTASSSVIAAQPQNTSDTISMNGAVAAGNLLVNTRPAYPEAARSARVQGAVVLAVLIAKDGSVENVTVTSGDALLRDAAVAAVKQWKYKPMLSNGQPVRVQTTVTVNFSLQ